MEDKPFTDASFEKFLNEEKIMGSRCQRCQALYLPPRPICVKCAGSDMAWAEIEGRGRLAAFTCISVGPAFMSAEGYDRNNPYCSGVVELEGSVRLDARIEGVDTRNPETIKVGTPVVAEFLHRGEGDDMRTFPAFRPAE